MECNSEKELWGPIHMGMLLERRINFYGFRFPRVSFILKSTDVKKIGCKDLIVWVVLYSKLYGSHNKL